MHINPWLAIDAAMSPASRARELRRAWEQFLGDGGLTDVRAPIAASWHRSRAAGVDPLTDRVASVAADSDEVMARWEMHPLSTAAPLILECLGAIADDAEHLIVVSDADGTLLWVEGNPDVRFDAAETMNFTEGAVWSEAGAGTNAIGTALAAEHAVQVFAAEHFNEVVQAWSCAAAPVHDPDSGSLLGVIDLTGRMTIAHPHTFTCAVSAARAVESDLRCAMHERDARLRARFGDRVAGRGRQVLAASSGRVLTDDPEGWVGAERLVLPPGGGDIVLPSGAHAFAEPVGREEAYIVHARAGDHARRARPLLRLRLLGHDRAVIERDGQPVQLSRRHTEILALLASHPQGMTTEELAADLHGDLGSPAGVRVEMYRLRKVLGTAIDPSSYRLATDVESDIGRVRGLLARGAILEAAERYEGPLLPRSEAPGVVRERDTLESWLRQAVMTSDDWEALWAWVHCRSGCDDLQAWQRLLAGLPFRDPRRSLAATQVRSLREA
jgi:hypothetical protein